MRKLALISTMGLLGFAAPLVGHAEVVYRSSEGWTAEGDPNNPSEKAAAELMAKAEGLEAAKNPGAALTAYRSLLKRYPTSAVAPKAQLKTGLLMDQMGEYEKAYEAFSTYLSKYPRGEDFEAAVEPMYKIAMLFFEGQKRKLFGVPISASMERAEQMLGGIVKNAPFSRLAPQAQFNRGQAFEKQGKNPEALVAYQAVVSRYPSDPAAASALYQIGYVRLLEHQKGSYDRASALKARDAFEEFVNRYPQSEKVAQARQNIQTLSGGDVRRTLDVAKFYDKTKSYKAAVIYYNEVIKIQPSGPETTFAKARIDELKARFGADALQPGPERTETGARAETRRKMQARVNTASRPDYVGPNAIAIDTETAPSNRPALRNSPQKMGPVTEPSLPEALAPDPALPKPPE